MTRAWTCSAIAAAALLALVSTAAAEVIFEEDYGSGFVGKGDVQNAYGWNNAVLQKQAKTVGFKYVGVETYEAECEWWTGPTHNRKRHTVNRTETSAVNGTIEYETRQRNQINGFILGGYLGDPTVTGEAPEVGDSCIGGGTGATFTSVEMVSSSGSLYVTTLEGNSSVIWSYGY